eukprot:TRINITY_DN9288_c0_g1_i11.p1 TRINITY_DN9288_c0_g1~~TRINITY_DN9288_c0_g1_i11.p1  ORF type:complete len:207 (+),score=63.78 TRINITY_DN9288_c0_g1_i11:225-845(+)
MVFIIYEMLKGILNLNLGNESLWKPYFDILPPADMLALWSSSELEELHDPELVQEAVKYRRDVEEEWLEVRAVLEKYPLTFSLEKISKEMFVFAYGNVVTRCFGWSLPCTMVVPFADAANHSSIDGDNELFDIQLHKLAIAGQSADKKLLLYATKDKMNLDFSDISHDLAKEERKVVKELLISEDTVEICEDATKAKEAKADIWNV